MVLQYPTYVIQAVKVHIPVILFPNVVGQLLQSVVRVIKGLQLLFTDILRRLIVDGTRFIL